MGNLFNKIVPLNVYQREAYNHIIVTGEASLLRLSAGNPMRSIIQRNVDEAREKIACL